MAQLYSLLEPKAVPDEGIDRGDMLYARRRMVLFREDRLVLINEFGILPVLQLLALPGAPSEGSSF